MKIILVLGTRPQIIKSAPIIHTAEGYDGINLRVVHTGQHYDYQMSKELFRELSLPDPIVNLGVGSGSHGWQTGQMLIGLERTFLDLKPDVVLVQGDTNSTIAGALAAVKMQIPVAHVEAGARSFDMAMPEEVNRRLVDHCSDLLLAVSDNCVRNLIKEGIGKDSIALVGDTMYESLVNHLQDIDEDDALLEYGLNVGDYAVLTLHRAENVDDPSKLNRIIKAIIEEDMKIIYPCHPRTKTQLEKMGLFKELEKTSHIKLLEPVPYFRMLNLVKNAKVLLTDSGGLQKEAYWLKTPCITLRNSTEWIETVEAGANLLVGSDPKKIKKALEGVASRKINNTGALTIPRASKKILDKIVNSYLM